MQLMELSGESGTRQRDHTKEYTVTYRMKCSKENSTTAEAVTPVTSPTSILLIRPFCAIVLSVRQLHDGNAALSGKTGAYRGCNPLTPIQRAKYLHGMQGGQRH